MNDAHLYSADNMMEQLPRVLDEDPRMHALALAIAHALYAHMSEISLTVIYAAIDALPEALLDILAHDFKVDWWDNSYSLAEKRKTLKGSFYVHRTLGTKYAVKTAISAIYPDAQIEEWFDYDGTPHTFRLIINVAATEISAEKHQRVLERIQYYKNVRSTFDGAVYVKDREAANHIYIGIAMRALKRIEIGCETPELVDIQYLADENGDLLADENGNVLVE